MTQDYTPLFQQLGYTFKDPELLRTALTHRSAGTPHNERLEFLGDSIVNYIMAEAVFQRFPRAREGELTRMRSSLVKGDTLAELARELKLGDYLLLGGGELKSGGWRRTSILSDAMEAVIGALFLDAGMEMCRDFLYRLYRERLQNLAPASYPKDAKTRLQEYLQAHKQALPEYEVVAVDGDPHEQYFEVRCHLPSHKRVTQGRAKSRRHAEQAAAQHALDLLQKK